MRSSCAASAGFVSSTKLRGRFAIRLCVFNHTTRQEDIEAVLPHFELTQVEDVVVPAPIEHDRDPRLDEGWLGAPRVDPQTVSRVALFSTVGARDVERIARMAREVRIPAGAAIVEQWDVGREFYVIVAALEWGASFSYPRLATVLATSDVRALVLPGPFFNELVRDAPSAGATIRGAVRARLPRM